MPIDKPGMTDKVDRLAELKNPQRPRPPPQPPQCSTSGAYDPVLDDMDSGASPDVSDDESSSSPEDDVSADGSPNSQAARVRVKEESMDATGARNPADGSSMPVQKRRRVTRACDECRRKKIKCDGKQPCTHCTVYSYGVCCPFALPLVSARG